MRSWTSKRSKPTLLSIWGVLAVALAAALFFITGAVGTGTPTIQSDKPDYNPGGTVVLSGGNWDTGGATVHIAVNDSVGNAWQYAADVPVANDGSITNTFQLPNTFVA